MKNRAKHSSVQALIEITENIRKRWSTYQYPWISEKHLIPSQKSIWFRWSWQAAVQDRNICYAWNSSKMGYFQLEFYMAVPWSGFSPIRLPCSNVWNPTGFHFRTTSFHFIFERFSGYFFSFQNVFACRRY